MSKSANGRSSIHRDASGTGWHGWVSFPPHRVTGKPVRKHVRGKTKAEVAAKVKKLEDARDGGYTALSQDVTLASYLRWWIELRRPDVKPKTVRGYETDLRNYVEPSAIGSLNLTKVTADHIDMLFREVRAMPPKRAGRQNLSNGTVAHLRRTLSAALRHAALRGRIAKNPMATTEKVSHQATEVVPLDADQMRRVLAVASGRRNAARWSFALALGIRQGEALGLQRENVDLDTATLVLDRQLQREPWKHGCEDPDKCFRPEATRRCPAGSKRRAADCPQRYGGGLVLNGRKGRTEGERHTLALHPELVEQLRAHFRTQAVERLAAGPLWDASQPQWVFGTETGGPIDPRADYQEWCDILAAAGLGHARLHDARHSVATLMLVAGVQPRVVQDHFDWKSPVLVQRYQHVVDEAKREAANRVGGLLFGGSS